MTKQACLHQLAVGTKLDCHTPPRSTPSLSFLPASPSQAIQYVQSHPDEVCPAGWKPGDKTMNPSPKKSKDYFKAI